MNAKKIAWFLFVILVISSMLALSACSRATSVVAPGVGAGDPSGPSEPPGGGVGEPGKSEGSTGGVLEVEAPAEAVRSGSDSVDAAAPAAIGEASGGDSSIPVLATAQAVQPAQAGLLTAGDVDDHLNFTFYQRYVNSLLQNNSSASLLPSVPVYDRVTLHLYGDDRQGLPNAWVRITPAGAQEPVLESFAAADGTFQFFPLADGAGDARVFTIEVGLPDDRQVLTSYRLDLDDLEPDRSVEIHLPGVFPQRPQALDLMFVIDTTGSMSDELSYLTNEFQSIVAAIQAEFPQISMSYSLIVYRDKGDAYVVRDFGFTTSAEEMQGWLADQRAEGGGDYPEAVQEALAAAMDSQWHSGSTARVLFHVADAPPHSQDYAAALEQAQRARRLGIHMYPLAASGVADEAEYLMRLSALLTHGRYLFLTDDSGVGNAHAEPHISCYVVTRLDQLLVRVITAELAGARIEPSTESILRTTGTYQNGICREPQQ